MESFYLGKLLLVAIDEIMVQLFDAKNGKFREFLETQSMSKMKKRLRSVG